MNAMKSIQDSRTVKLRKKIWHNIIQMCMQEIQWFNKVATVAFIHKKQQMFSLMKHNNDQSETTTLQEHMTSTLRMKLMCKWKMPQDFHYCWFKFLLDLWPRQTKTRLYGTYYNCLTQMYDSLPDDFQHSLKNDYWLNEWNGIMCNSSYSTFQYKCDLPELLYRGVMAIHTAVSTQVGWCTRVKNLHNTCQIWGLELSVLCFTITAATFPDIMKYYWQCEERLDNNYLFHKNGIGVDVFAACWCAFFSMPNSNKFTNVRQLIESVLPVYEWRVESRIIKRRIKPAIFDKIDLDNFKYNGSSSNNHWTKKLGWCPFIVGTVICNKHPEMVKFLLGSAKFCRNASFASKVLKLPTSNQCFMTLYQCLKWDSIKLPSQMETDLWNTLNNITANTVNVHANPRVPGLSIYSADCIKRCMCFVSLI